jgi:hypothetical protein
MKKQEGKFWKKKEERNRGGKISVGEWDLVAFFPPIRYSVA